MDPILTALTLTSTNFHVNLNTLPDYNTRKASITFLPSLHAIWTFLVAWLMYAVRFYLGVLILLFIQRLNFC